jgi:hypothetical protein
MTANPLTPAGNGTTAAGGPSVEVLGSAITRLVPIDGLFLRAEHLERIQSYARALATAVARAGGPGVVDGYTTRIAGGALRIGPGLAIDGTGQPLLLGEDASLDLPDPSAAAAGGQGGGNGFWVLEVAAAEGPTGTPEQVFGTLCDDPCDGGQRHCPYRAGGVKLRLRPDSLPLPGGWTADAFRSVLTSEYFERERSEAARLLPASERDPAPTAELASALWSQGVEPVDLGKAGAVPIGLLLRASGDWVVDVWAARRDRIEPPPRRGWARRLGMRPWDVFLAQVLQFQANLADLGPGVANLPDAGIVELPPAGYLPVVPGSGRSIDDQVTELLGSGVELRFCSARPDDIGLALEQAQHLDRIGLTAGRDDPARRPAVDILIPGGRLAPAPAPSTVQFAAGTLRTGTTGFEQSGLARMEWETAGPARFAFAGSGTSPAKRVHGIWLDLTLRPIPTRTPRDPSFSLDLRFASHQPPRAAEGEANLRIDLSGVFTSQRTAEGTGGATDLDGAFEGRYLRRSGKSADDHSLTVPMRLSIARDQQGRAVSVEISGNQNLHGTVSLFQTGTGALGVLAKLSVPRLDLELKLTENPSAVLPGSQARADADKGLALLDKTELPQLAPQLLFAGAMPAGGGNAYRTAHNWVFFTRRHAVDCGPELPTDAPAVRLDLYTQYVREPEATARAIAQGDPIGDDAEYVAQLEWDGASYLLGSGSAAAVGSWKSRHKSEQPGAAVAWFGPWRVPAEALVSQVLDVMGDAEAPVVEGSGAPGLRLSPSSAGALLVLIEPPADDSTPISAQPIG